MPFRRPPLGGFFGDTEEPESEERFDDTWEDLAARHPELANLRSPWATWGARKRRGSAAGNERPTTDFGNDSRNRFFRDSFYDNIPPEFRERIPNRWNQHFEPENNQGQSQTIPNQEQQQQQQQQEPTSEEVPSQTSTDKATQTAGQANASEKNLPKQSLPQYGLRNTVDLGQKTAAEPGQLDAESARNQRSMSAPPDGRFSSPQRSHSNSNNTNATPPNATQQQQTEQTNNKQPNVRVIPIFVEGRDEPVINSKAEKAESRPTPPKDDDFFVNHDIPHGFHQQPQFGRNFGTQFKNFGNRPTTGSAFGPSKVFQQQQRHPPQQEQAPQTFTFKAPTQTPNKTAQEETQKHVDESQHEEPPRQQSPQPPQSQTQPINDAISKIQLIQKDVLELMTQVENFSGKTKKNKEYIYLDEMLTRNLLKLDDIETEGKENIRLARKEAIKCIQKCIAVLEAKAENASANRMNDDDSTDDQPTDILSNESDSKGQPDANNTPKPQDEKMDVADESQKSKSVGKKKRDKSKDNKNGASSVQKMDVERVDEQCENKNAVSATTDAQVVDKCKNNTNGSSASMEVDSVASSQ